MQPSILYTSLLALIYSTSNVIADRTITFINECTYNAWPASTISDTTSNTISGFELSVGQQKTVSITSTWNGRIWARTGCTFDSAGNGHCDTGDCGNLACNTGGQIPVTLVELNLGSDMSFYDISMVDGFNIPMSLQPNTYVDDGCITPCVSTDINSICPSELSVKNQQGVTVACMSECTATGSAAACCSGKYDNANMCKPTTSSELFKQAAPDVYSYAWDNNATFECQSPSWTITLCPDQHSIGSNATATVSNNTTTAVPSLLSRSMHKLQHMTRTK